MNERADLVASLPWVERRRRLEREGVRCLRSPSDDGRRFTVTMYDLEATDVRRLPGDGVGVDGDYRRHAEPDDRLRRIVVRAAQRALYALGLDYGQVEVATDGGGRSFVAGVSPEMRPSRGDGAIRTVGAIAAKDMLVAAEEACGVLATLGADPEFVLVNRAGKVVPASRYLPADGWAGCDSVVRRGVRLWPLVELRPKPAAEPAEVVAAIRRLLAACARQVGGGSDGGEPLAWRAGALPVRGLPLGGHVHVSGAALTGERLRALDHAVALPLRLLEPPGAAGRRPRYGALGDFRRQPHGGFEYRTPPSWLLSPRLALGVLALAKIAAEHAPELAAARPLEDDAVRDAFYGAEDEAGGRADAGADGGAGEKLLRTAAMQVFEVVRGTAGYRKYESEAGFVFDAVASGRHWDETADIRVKWGV